MRWLYYLRTFAPTININFLESVSIDVVDCQYLYSTDKCSKTTVLSTFYYLLTQRGVTQGISYSICLKINLLLNDLMCLTYSYIFVFIP